MLLDLIELLMPRKELTQSQSHKRAKRTFCGMTEVTTQRVVRHVLHCVQESTLQADDGVGDQGKHFKKSRETCGSILYQFP